MICSRCKKRPAVVFITRMEDNKTVNDGLCLVCAKELGIKPVGDLLDKLGVTEEDIDQLGQQMGELMNIDGEEGEDFVPGGAATFPFLQNLFGGNIKPAEESGVAPAAGSNEPAGRDAWQAAKK